MGQYYKAVNLDTQQCIESWDYESGSKLMEHSWMENPFVQAVERALKRTGQWYMNRIVWAGDYMQKGLFDIPNDYTLHEYSDRYFEKIRPFVPIILERYIVNHSKKQYVDRRNVKDKNGWKIHPLPLLTASGNGNGGGDYWGSSMELVGSWAGDIISLESYITEGFNEIIPNFEER